MITEKMCSKKDRREWKGRREAHKNKGGEKIRERQEGDGDVDEDGEKGRKREERAP